VIAPQASLDAQIGATLEQRALDSSKRFGKVRRAATGAVDEEDAGQSERPLAGRQVT